MSEQAIARMIDRTLPAAPHNALHPTDPESATPPATDGSEDSLTALQRLPTLVPQLSLLALTWIGREVDPIVLVGGSGIHG